ncbi:PASTA domain-containing protein, partial [Kocuria sp.]|uniref:PASTA domain-containing protein n=1 Tax=Kocuria sp. TaxID=1871328 RepID=UPI00289A6465
PATVDVPNTLVGQSLDNARNALREAGLSVGAVSTVNSATVPENVVLSTDPAGGTTVEKDSAVQLQVSTGRVTVPDVVGMSRTEAQDALRADDVRLNYNIAVRDSEEESTGTVLEQSAPAGSAVAQGSTITLTIAREVTPSPTATPEPSDEPTQDPTPSTGPESDGDGQNASPSPSGSQG